MQVYNPVRKSFVFQDLVKKLPSPKKMCQIALFVCQIVLFTCLPVPKIEGFYLLFF